jgi:rubrerythrin
MATAGPWPLSGTTHGQLLELAAAVEQGLFDFYARLSSRAIEARMRAELWALRDEEALHRAWFLGALRDDGGRPGGDLPAGLRAALDERILQPLARAFDAPSFDARAALSTGLEMEGVTIELFASLRHAVGAARLPGLDRIIREQKRHRTRLRSLRRS